MKPEYINRQNSHMDRSGNTYIEFSFEKSLRKYEKQPHKKIKPNQSKHLNRDTQNNYVKMEKSTQNFSVDRIRITLQNRQSYLYSNKRQQTFDKKRNDYSCTSKPNHEQAMMESENKISSFQSIQEDGNGRKMQEPNEMPHGKRSFNVQQYEISIEKALNEDCCHMSEEKVQIYSEANNNNLRKQAVTLQEDSTDETFSQISIIKSIEKKQNNINQNELQHQSDSNNNHMQKLSDNSSMVCEAEENNTQPQKVLQNNPSKQAQAQIILNHVQNIIEQLPNTTSYAYFSSVSSLDSIAADNHENKQQLQSQNAENNQKALQIIQFESKEELKKQSIRQERQRKFYQVKKIKDLQGKVEMCEQLSGNLKKSLMPQFERENQIQNNQEKLNRQPTNNSRVPQGKQNEAKTQPKHFFSVFSNPLGRIGLPISSEKQYKFSIRNFKKLIIKMQREQKFDIDSIVNVILQKRPYLVADQKKEVRRIELKRFIETLANDKIESEMQ